MKSSGRSNRKLKRVPFILGECAVTLGFVLHLNTGIQPGQQRLTEGTGCVLGVQRSAGRCVFRPAMPQMAQSPLPAGEILLACSDH